MDAERSGRLLRDVAPLTRTSNMPVHVRSPPLRYMLGSSGATIGGLFVQVHHGASPDVQNDLRLHQAGFIRSIVRGVAASAPQASSRACLSAGPALEGGQRASFRTLAVHI